MTRNLLQGLCAFVLMLSAAVAALVLQPTQYLARIRLVPVNLDTSIPTQFREWKVDTTAVKGIVNPQETELIQKLYSQTLYRTYINKDGSRIMLSIAYGEDQRDELQVHHPEVCYPAQGFTLLSKTERTLDTGINRIPVRNLETKLGSLRNEPVTYWLTVGNQVTLGGFDKKLKELSYGLRGKVPDGLLFRVSSIGARSDSEFLVQSLFIQELVQSLDPATRLLIIGQI